VKYASVKDPAAVLAHLDRMEEVRRQQAEKIAQLRFQMEWQLAVEALGLSLDDVERFHFNAATLAQAINEARKGKTGDEPRWYRRLGRPPTSLQRGYARGRAMVPTVHQGDIAEWLRHPKAPTIVTHAELNSGASIELPSPIVKVKVA